MILDLVASCSCRPCAFRWLPIPGLRLLAECPRAASCVAALPFPCRARLPSVEDTLPDQTPFGLLEWADYVGGFCETIGSACYAYVYAGAGRRRSRFTMGGAARRLSAEEALQLATNTAAFVHRLETEHTVQRAGRHGVPIHPSRGRKAVDPCAQ